jgi:hypothetical protein
MKKIQDKAPASSHLMKNNEIPDAQPFLEWKYTFDEKTGNSKFKSIELSDGSSPSPHSLIQALKRSTGTTDARIGEKILHKVARGMSAERYETRMNEASAFLAALQPKNETEALLFGQFLSLQDSGMQCLRRANFHEQRLDQQERLFNLANKLLNTANQTMQTILKYRCGGQQTMQVLHVHNEGQAIVAQNLSASPMKQE